MFEIIGIVVTAMMIVNIGFLMFILITSESDDFFSKYDTFSDKVVILFLVSTAVLLIPMIIVGTTLSKKQERVIICEEEVQNRETD